MQRGPSTFNILVPEFERSRLREVDAATGDLVRYLFEGSLAGPRAVAAGGGYIAVSESEFAEDRVTVFDADTGDIVSVVGGTYGEVDGRFENVRGVCITADGRHLLAADTRNCRVCMFDLVTGAFLRHIVTGLPDRPYNVVQCDDGFIVACTVAYELLHVTHDGTGEGALRLGPVGLCKLVC